MICILCRQKIMQSPEYFRHAHLKSVPMPGQHVLILEGAGLPLCFWMQVLFLEYRGRSRHVLQMCTSSGTADTILEFLSQKISHSTDGSHAAAGSTPSGSSPDRDIQIGTAPKLEHNSLTGRDVIAFLLEVVFNSLSSILNIPKKYRR